MKSLIIIVILVILFGLIGISYLQNTIAQQNEKLQVLLQLQIRNSEGHLVSYVEGTKIIDIQQNLLNEYLDEKPNKKIIVKEGKIYELIQWHAKTEKFDKVHANAIFQLWVKKDGEWLAPLIIVHNGYQVEPGDTATVYWTIMRPNS